MVAFHFRKVDACAMTVSLFAHVQKSALMRAPAANDQTRLQVAPLQVCKVEVPNSWPAILVLHRHGTTYGIFAAADRLWVLCPSHRFLRCSTSTISKWCVPCSLCLACLSRTQGSFDAIHCSRLFVLPWLNLDFLRFRRVDRCFLHPINTRVCRQRKHLRQQPPSRPAPAPSWAQSFVRARRFLALPTSTRPSTTPSST